MCFYRVTVSLALSGLVLCAQSDAVVRSARQYRETHERQIVDSLMDLLAVPNVAADPANLRRNAERVAHMFQQRGVETRLLEHQGAPPVVYGELLKPGATRTILFYAHYDGSPVSSKEWTTPPFRPVLRSGPLERDGQVIAVPETGTSFNPEWRIYARAASDDKAPIIALL